MSGTNLSKEDLFILLETYQNSIKLNTTLLEKQNQLIELQNKVLDKQDALLTKHSEVTQDLANFTKDFHHAQEQVDKDIEVKQSTLVTAIGDMSDNVDGMKDGFTQYKIDNVKEHNKLSTKIYVAIGGMATIILTLIALWKSSIDKLAIVNEIAKHLGVF